MANEFKVGEKVKVDGWKGVGYIATLPYGEEMMTGNVYVSAKKTYGVRVQDATRITLVEIVPEHLTKA